MIPATLPRWLWWQCAALLAALVGCPSDPPPPPAVTRFEPDVRCGTAPLRVTFHTDVHAAAGARCVLDGDGDGRDDLTLPDCAAAEEVRFTYARPGFFHPRLRVEDVNGTAQRSADVLVASDVRACDGLVDGGAVDSGAPGDAVTPTDAPEVPVCDPTEPRMALLQGAQVVGTLSPDQIAASLTRFEGEARRHPELARWLADTDSARAPAGALLRLASGAVVQIVARNWERREGATVQMRTLVHVLRGDGGAALLTYGERATVRRDGRLDVQQELFEVAEAGAMRHCQVGRFPLDDVACGVCSTLWNAAGSTICGFGAIVVCGPAFLATAGIGGVVCGAVAAVVCSLAGNQVEQLDAWAICNAVGRQFSQEDWCPDTPAACRLSQLGSGTNDCERCESQARCAISAGRDLLIGLVSGGMGDELLGRNATLLQKTQWEALVALVTSGAATLEGDQPIDTSALELCRAVGRCDCRSRDTRCHGQCVNLRTSSAHCGACDRPCLAAEGCVDGTCRGQPPSSACLGPASQPCGRCGTQTRTCEGYLWSPWGPCTGEGACAPGSTRACSTGGGQTCTATCTWSPCPTSCTGASSQPCGRCGTQTRVCTSGMWSSWGTCANEGACTPGTSRTCPDGSAQTCSATCAWGACPTTCPGASSQPCGRCGTQTRTCVGGAWSAWGACVGEGACAPGSVQACAGGTQTCTSLCAWDACRPCSTAGPAGLTATRGAATVRLTWGGVPGATRYLVTRTCGAGGCPPPGATAVCDTAATSCDDADAPLGADCVYGVYARGPCGMSGCGSFAVGRRGATPCARNVCQDNGWSSGRRCVGSQSVLCDTNTVTGCFYPPAGGTTDCAAGCDRSTGRCVSACATNACVEAGARSGTLCLADGATAVRCEVRDGCAVELDRQRCANGCDPLLPGCASAPFCSRSATTWRCRAVECQSTSVCWRDVGGDCGRWMRGHGCPSAWCCP